MAEAKKDDEKNPTCTDCGNSTEATFDCSSCFNDFCLNCINQFIPEMISRDLLSEVKKFQTFQWSCHHCAENLLPTQLLIDGKATHAELIKLGVPKRAFTYRIKRSPPSSSPQDKSSLESLKAQNEAQKQTIETLLKQLRVSSHQQSLQDRQDDEDDYEFGLFDNPISSAVGGEQSRSQSQPTPAPLPAPPPSSKTQVSFAGFQTYPTYGITAPLGSITSRFGTVPAHLQTTSLSPPYVPRSSSTAFTQPISSLSVTPSIGYASSAEGYHPAASIGGSYGLQGNQFRPGIFPIGTPDPGSGFHLPLPTLKLKQFGNPATDDFTAWWYCFSTNVDQLPIDETKKWTYLQMSIREGSSAAKKIQGLGQNPANYRKALEILFKNYKDDRSRKTQLWEALKNLEKVNKSLQNLEDWIDTVRCTTEALLSLGVTVETLNEYTNTYLLEKLPASIMDQIMSARMVLETLQPGRYQSEMKLSDLLDHLVNILKSTPRSHLSEAAGRDSIGEQKISTMIQGKPAKTPKKSSDKSSDKQKPKMAPCSFCEGNHWNDECKRFKTPEERFAVAKEKKLCFNCLKNHRIKDCTRTRKCYYCGMKHNQALCRKRNSKNDKPSDNKETPEKSNSGGPKMLAALAPSAPPEEKADEEENQDSKTVVKLASGQRSDTNGSDDSIAIMATLPALVINPETGESLRVNAYLDSGSQSTNILADIAKRLSLKVTDSTVLKTARFGDAELQDIKAEKVNFILQGDNGFQMNLAGWSVPTICATLTNEPITLSKETENMMKKLAVVNKPPHEKQEMDIHVLIGMDFYNYIMTAPDTSVQCLQGSLRVHETPYGAILSGCSDVSSNLSKKQKQRLNKSFLAVTKRQIHELYEQDTVGIKLTKEENLWDLKSINIDENEVYSNRNSEVHKFFRETIRQREDGRFEVRFPFRPGITVSNNFNVALKRLQLVLDKLCPNVSDLSLLNQYDNVFKDHLEQGIIEPIELSEPGRIIHYVSHFAVIKESSTTTKLRVVLDPSTKTATGYSLNETIYKGDNTLEDLTGILLRFSLSKYPLITDIKQAFLQVALHNEDMDCVRFLWLKDTSNPTVRDNLQAYRYTRVPFGVLVSPFLLGATINYLLELYPSEASTKCQSNYYVDNILLQSNSMEECVRLYQGVTDLFAKGKFQLREWQTNCAEVFQQIPEKERAKGDEMKVLGLQWNVKTDTLSTKPVKVTDTPPTKRLILKNVAECFDPMGKMGPVTIKGKILYQECCKLGLSWDTVVPEKIQNEWNSFKTNLKQLSDIKFPRKVIDDMNQPVELLCFTDASESAYCTCIFIRNQGSRVSPTLIFAKTRVSPITPRLSIPKLETTALVIGKRAIEFVEKHIKMKVNRKTIWCDSQIVLNQIKSGKSDTLWGQRRLDEIKTLKNVEYFYVPTSHNCADLGTRGITIDEFRQSSWVKGPDWLTRDENPVWPMNEARPQIAFVSKIQRKEYKEKNKESDEQHKFPFDIDVTKYQSLTKLFTVTSYCRRFINRLKKVSTRSEIICANDLADAKLEWIQTVQEQEFSEIFEALKTGKKNKLISQLDLFVDTQNIIRCGGRLINAPMEYDARFPILLPKNHQFTTLAIKDAHSSVFHFKTKHTLCKLRTMYWVPSGGSQVRKIINQCNCCQKIEGGPFKPPNFAPLPIERVTQSAPFSYTLLDYCGPVIIRIPGISELQKRWIACFGCMSTRAVHLELVTDCSTEAAIRAIERFVARRGTPKLILSDNASCFLKAAKFINKLWKTADIDENYAIFFAKAGIKFRTAPERSPHHQGAIERLVSHVKKSLKVALYRAVTTEDQLRTWIIKAEANLNQRPITSNPTHHDDLGVLTPANFLSPNIFLSLPQTQSDVHDPDFNPHGEARDDLLELYNKGNRRLETFEKMFRTSYLQELRQRGLEFKSKKGEINRLPTGV